MSYTAKYTKPWPYDSVRDDEPDYFVWACRPNWAGGCGYEEKVDE